MKKIFLLFIVILLSLSFVNSYSQSNCSTPPCYDNNLCDCLNWSDWQNSDIVLTAAPDFPNCSLVVNYCYRQCLDKPECVELYIKGFQPTVPYCNECDDFFASFNTNDEWVNARVLRRIFTSIWRQIVYIKWEQFLNGIDPSEYPYCDSPNTPRKKYFAYMAKCMAYCKTQGPIGIDAEWLVVAKQCTPDFCCVKWIELCIDRNTGNTISNEYSQTDPNVDCNSQQISMGVCHPGFNVTVTECIDNCEN